MFNIGSFCFIIIFLNKLVLRYFVKEIIFSFVIEGKNFAIFGNRQIQKSFSEWIQQSKKGIAVLLLWKRIKHFICLAKSKRHFLCWSNRKVIWGKDYSLKPWEPQALPLRKWEQSINYQRKQTSLKLIKISAEIQTRPNWAR